MRLLILTQKVDRADAVLGFFHRWLEEYAKHSTQVTVICLQEGEHVLPPNVSVLSLGKETRQSRVQYLVRFYRYIWKYRHGYDSVFVHMNPEYMALGGLLWRLWGKKLLMWYNHPQGNLWINIASVYAHRVFHTSPFAYARKFTKAIRMPAGIDTDFFKKDAAVLRSPNSILSLGRIAPIKYTDDIARACSMLVKRGKDFMLSVYGSPGPKDADYYKRVRDVAKELEESGRAIFSDEVSNSKTPALYSAHEVFVNATPTGSFDKAILEAMACECIVVVSNHSFVDVLPSDLLFIQGDELDLARSLNFALALTPDEKEKLGKIFRQYVEDHHGLEELIKKMLAFA